MSIKSRWDTFEFTDYLNVDTKEIKDLPDGISISTMCASCKLNTRLNIPNIEKYLQLNSDDVLTVKMNKERTRSLITIKNKPKRMKKEETKTKQKDTSKNHFYNQITVVVRVNQGPTKDLNEVPKINMKLFKNGSVQMSGCKSIKNINFALNKLISKLKEVKAKIEDGKIIEKTFIEDTIHGYIQEDCKHHGEDGFRNHKLFIYHPEGNIRRSYHTDGREGTRKFTSDDDVWGYTE